MAPHGHNHTAAPFWSMHSACSIDVGNVMRLYRRLATKRERGRPLSRNVYRPAHNFSEGREVARFGNRVTEIRASSGQRASRALSSIKINAGIQWLKGAQMPATHGSLLERITVDSDVRFGKPCIRGHRITVQEILEWLSGGASQQQILADCPQPRTPPNWRGARSPED